MPASALRAALDTLVYDSLRPVTLGLSGLYALFALTHLFFLPAGIAPLMSLVTAGTAVVLMSLSLSLSYRPIPVHWAHPLGTGIAALVLLNSLLLLAFLDEPRQTTNVMVLVIGVGLFFLSTRWFVGVLGAILLSWGSVVWQASPSPEWVHFGFGLLSATVLSGLVYTVRVRTFRRLEGLRLQDERQKRELEGAIRAVQHSEGALRRLNAMLEQRVQERTAALEDTNAALRAEIAERQRAEEAIQSLLRIGKRLNSTLNLNILMDTLVEETITLACAESGFSGLRSPEGMVCQKYFQNSAILPFKHSWPPGQGLPGWLISHKVPYLTNDAPRDRQMTYELFEQLGVRSVMSTPILDNQGEVIGFFEVHNKIGDSGFTQSDQDKLAAVAQTASIAVQNALAYQKIRRTEEQLRSSHEQFIALSGYLISVREEERTRIAREIHDELGQALTGLKMDLARLESRLSGTSDTVPPPALQEKVRSMATLVDTTIQSVRRIATDLRPGVLDNFGLAAAIEWQAQEFQNRTGIRCTFTSALEDANVDQERCTAVFRILQEALTNVARHAGATRAAISLQEAAGHLILEVKDNGKGITDSDLSKTKSFGLLGMRERASLLEGELHISGVQGKGTTITVRIPLEQSGRE